MKTIAKKNQHNKIAIVLLVVLLCNFLSPNYSYAEEHSARETNNFLGQFFCSIGDIIMETLQEEIAGIKGLKYNGTYGFRYTPATIVSGTLAAFDINFISPMPKEERYKVITPEITIERKTTTLLVKTDNNQEIIVGFKTGDGILSFLQIFNNNWRTEYTPGEDLIRRSDAISYIRKIQDKYSYNDENVKEKEEFTSLSFDKEPQVFSWWNKDIGNNQIERYTIYVSYQNNLMEEAGKEVRVYSVYATKGVYQKEAIIESIASILRNVIATWYKVSREIALIGLLCILAYVGIRGIIFSSTTDKAKYKKLLFDWLTAVVIVMTLHFIISITLTTTKAITDIFAKRILDENGIDIVMSKVRDNVNSDDFISNALNQVMYYYLVILTIKYTIQYFKRVVHIGFLTMIGPLIGLTYPLDKIKDGQAQAFTTWIREFVFTALLQPLHLVLYYVFIGSAAMTTFSEENPLYALIVMSFLPQAEKMIRKMFGFEKAGKLGNVEAAFGGAAVMNMINQLGSLGRAKNTTTRAKGNEGEEQKTKIRTANNGANPYAALMSNNNAESQEGAPEGGSAPTNAESQEGAPEGGAAPTNAGSQEGAPEGGAAPANAGSQEGAPEGGAAPANAGSQGGTPGGTTPANAGSQGGTPGGTTPANAGSQGGTPGGTTPANAGSQGGAPVGATPANAGSQGGTPGGAAPANTGARNINGIRQTTGVNTDVPSADSYETNGSRQQGSRNDENDDTDLNNSRRGRISSLASSVRARYREINEIPTIKGIKAVGGKVFFATAKGALRGGLRIAGAATLGTIGLAAGLTTGDASKAIGGLTGGIIAGNKIGGSAANGAINTANRFARRGESRLRRTFEEGRYGEQEAAKRERVRQIKKTKEYRNLLDKFKGKEKEIDKFLNAGITDIENIRIALQNSDWYSTDNAIAYMHMAELCPAEIFEDREKFKIYLESHGIPKDKADEIYKAVRQFR